MTAHAHPEPWTMRRRTQIVALAFAALMVTLGALLLHAGNKRSERVSLDELSTDDRKALYDRTLETLQTSCAEQQGGLDEFCREQADFIVQFPECDRTCSALAERYRNQATR